VKINPQATQKIAIIIVWLAALITLGILFFIIFYILREGLPVINFRFLLDSPRKLGREGGIFPTILGTLFLAIVAVAIAGPLGVGTAIYLAEYTRESKFTSAIRFGAECLAGVPSIIFGLFGFAFFVVYLRLGWSILSGGLTLTCMILPTIIRTSEEAIKAVPYIHREVSFALGGTKWQTVSRTVLPSAWPGIATGIILALGRSISETAAVILTAGTSLRLPTSIFSPTRTMAVHFYILAREGISLRMAYGTGAVLIVFILIINLIANHISRQLAIARR